MNYYKYHVKLEFEIMAETEEEAEETLDAILPTGDGVWIEQIDLRDVEEITFADAVEGCERR